MPTLEFLRHREIAAELPPIEKYGFRAEFFDDIKTVMRNIERDDEELNPSNTDRITSKLLRTGPCPNSSRVYFQLVGDPKYPSRHEGISTLLDVELPEERDRRNVGNDFEEWIDKANEAVNSWLESGDKNVVHNMDVLEPIKEFYLNRLDDIETKAERLGIPLESLTMEVQQSFRTQFFHPAAPDGAWLLENVEGHPGGVFESKLSPLPTPVDRYVLTGYAAYIEKDRTIRLDTGVFLYLDKDDERIVLESFYIDDDYRDEIRRNLERFATLVQLSKEKGEWENGGNIEDRLVRPPEPDYMAYCDDCLYREECHDV